MDISAIFLTVRISDQPLLIVYSLKVQKSTELPRSCDIASVVNSTCSCNHARFAVLYVLEPDMRVT